MNKILSKNHPLLKKQDNVYCLDIYNYVDDLKWLVKRAGEKEEIPISLNVILNHILNLFQIVYPQGVKIEILEEMLDGTK